jgi:hypothetical protein
VLTKQWALTDSILALVDRAAVQTTLPRTTSTGLVSLAFLACQNRSNHKAATLPETDNSPTQNPHNQKSLPGFLISHQDRLVAHRNGNGT